jgi:N6-adenosine-specific RNA methylase IME4
MLPRVLTADPPWPFRDKLPGPTRGAAKNYRCEMTVEDIKRYPLPALEDDAVLFLWRVAAMQEEALAVVRSWGFAPKTEVVWLKLTKHGKRHFGMGRIVRAEHETCIIATRGRPRRLLKNIRSTFEARVGKHSEKPEAFYELVEALYEGPYVELFARRRRLGWESFGDELERETG